MTNKDEDRYLGSDHFVQLLLRNSRQQEELLATGSIVLWRDRLVPFFRHLPRSFELFLVPSLDPGLPLR